jgi:NADH dehydrogenase FAD-containing subunit
MFWSETSIAVDMDARRPTVDTLGESRELDYDSLIVATGAQQSYLASNRGPACLLSLVREC